MLLTQQIVTPYEIEYLRHLITTSAFPVCLLVYKKERLKSVCSASKTGESTDILVKASLPIIFYRKRKKPPIIVRIIFQEPLRKNNFWL